MFYGVSSAFILSTRPTPTFCDIDLIKVFQRGESGTARGTTKNNEEQVVNFVDVELARILCLSMRWEVHL